MDLSRLLAPKSLVVIGGGAWATNVIANARGMGFAGPIYHIHPKRPPIDGAISFASVAEIPSAPDAAYIAVNRHATIDVLRELATMGAGGAVAFASGFSEASAEDARAGDLQAALVAAAGDMPVLGPNCYGFLNYVDRVVLWPDQHGGIPVAAGVALLTQSSNIAINLTMQSSALPISHVFTLGNQAQISLPRLALGIIEDARVRALGLHIEGITDRTGFEALAARAAALGKPVVVLKIGGSAAARAAAISHTASLAGDHAIAHSFFDRLGFAVVDNLSEFHETLKLAFVTGGLPSPSAVSLSCSGGEAGLMADLGATLGVDFPHFDPETTANLRQVLGGMVALANPLDYHTYIWPHYDKMRALFAAASNGPQAINMLVLDYPRPDRCRDHDWDSVEQSLVDAAAETRKGFAVIGSMAGSLPEARAQRLLDAGLVPLVGMREALVAVGALGRAKYNPTPLAPMVVPATTRRLEEADAKARLAQYGVATPKGVRTRRAEISAAASGLRTPLVLKAEGFAHKTEAGAVALNLFDQASLTRAADAMVGDWFLVEEMITGGVLELIIGVINDPQIGLTLSIGAGGTMAEILNDRALLLVPSDSAAIERALDSLRIAPLLGSFRGRPALDRAGIVATILAVQEFVIANTGRLAEIEINPLLVGHDFTVAVDALIIGDF